MDPQSYFMLLVTIPTCPQFPWVWTPGAGLTLIHSFILPPALTPSFHTCGNQGSENWLGLNSALPASTSE
jgi:hypothetical protein